MCRLFAQAGNDGEPARFGLVESERSLLSQASARPTALQRDGWGIAWYRRGEPRPTVRKGREGPVVPAEREAFVDAATEAHGPLVLAHIRKASDPRGLGRERVLGLANSQPFSFGPILFAHNGSIPHPDATLPRLGAHAKDVQGVNDSEVLFYLWLCHYEERRDPLAAFVRTVHDLVEVSESAGHPGEEPFSGLNVLLGLGPGELWAFALAAPTRAMSLRTEGWPYFDLAWRSVGSGLLLASEPLDADLRNWSALRSGQFLSARRAGLASWEVRTGTLPDLPPIAPVAAAASGARPRPLGS